MFTSPVLSSHVIVVIEEVLLRLLQWGDLCSRHPCYRHTSSQSLKKYYSVFYSGVICAHVILVIVTRHLVHCSNTIRSSTEWRSMLTSSLLSSHVILVIIAIPFDLLQSGDLCSRHPCYRHTSVCYCTRNDSVTCSVISMHTSSLLSSRVSVVTIPETVWSCTGRPNVYMPLLSLSHNLVTVTGTVCF